MSEEKKSALNDAGAEPATSSSFIHSIIENDLQENRHHKRVHTRFPPEPNGYLHIGHAKAISLDFGLAAEYGGKCNLRFDDTNPSKEDVEYVDAIIRDVRWLGYDWEDRLYFASDYFGQLYEFAVVLIKKGKAYVDDLSADEIREYRGTLTEPGKESPSRGRTLEENLDLFKRMRDGEFEDGSKVLRAKIDMGSPNLNMRDPVMYRILRATHHRTGDDWCIYPMYDFAHGQSDAIEKITHSICTLEFEDHRPLYDWFLQELGFTEPPRQIEFARFNLSYTLTSKRKLLQLVEAGIVDGWDDPRMPTIAGIRRRGFTPEAIRQLCERVGTTKSNSTAEYAQLEHAVREDLNKRAPRVMAVLDPLRLVIENYPEDIVEELEAKNNPEDESAGTRKIPFSKVLYIERSDFMEEPSRRFFRLGPGREVRLNHAYYVTCTGFEKDKHTGEVVEVRCSYDPQTRGGWSKDGRKIKGTLHWVSAEHSLAAEVRIYEHLFTNENPAKLADGESFLDNVNQNSLEIISSARVEPGLKGAEAGSRYQFLRTGYFVVDSDSTVERPVFNRIVTLRDSWAKIQKKQ